MDFGKKAARGRFSGVLFLSHLMPDDDMAKLLKQYHLGVESIEFSIGYCLDSWEEKVAAYRKRLQAMDWEGPLTVHGPFLDLNPVSWDSKVAEATCERFCQAYQAACELGAIKIVYHSCFVPMVSFLEGWTERMIEFWNDFMEDKGTQITVCLENVFDPEYAPFREIAKNVKHPAFGLCLDIGHTHCSSMYAAEEWLENLYPYIRHLHLHDNHGIRDDHLGIGQGGLQWEWIFAFIRENLPQADAVIENADRRYCEASLAALEKYGMMEHFCQSTK